MDVFSLAVCFTCNACVLVPELHAFCWLCAYCPAVRSKALCAHGCFECLYNLRGEQQNGQGVLPAACVG